MSITFLPEPVVLWSVMSTAFKFYKRKIKNSLEPLLVMLVAKQQDMPAKKWNAMLKKTVSSVVSNPHEYLGDELPEFQLVCDILHEIFEQFCKAKCNAKTSPFPLIAEELYLAKKRLSHLNSISTTHIP
jgi:hypothetical protein